MNTYLNELRDYINRCTYIVDNDMLDYFDEKVKTGSYSSRINAEAESLEFALRQQNVTTLGEIVPGEPYQWRNDGVYKSLKLDFKRKPRIYQNICIKPKQAQESYEMGELTHIVAFSVNIETSLQIGDKLQFKCHKIYTVRDAIVASRSNGGYSLLNAI